MKNRACTGLSVIWRWCLAAALLPWIHEARAQTGELTCPPPADQLTLPYEHELCAMQSGIAGPELKQHFNANVWPHAYAVAWKRIPASDRARLEKVMKSAPPDDTRIVVIIREKRPQWLTVHDKHHTGDQLAAGGGGVWGGVLRHCLVDGKQGHYEVTAAAAKDDHWPEQVRGFLARASREADEYEWNEPAAHGQTENGATENAGKDKFKKTVIDYGKQIRAACAAGGAENVTRAVYVLGYLLHATQDLSSHAGQTNEEHAYRALVGDNPDSKDKRVERAERWSKRVLEIARAELLQTCLKDVYALQKPSAIDGLPERLFGPKDGTALALATYQQSGFKYMARQPKPAPVLWFDPESNEQADRFFEDYIVQGIKP